MRHALTMVALALALLTSAWSLSQADESKGTKPGSRTPVSERKEPRLGKAKEKDPVSAKEREKRVMAFVSEHHPELVSLLEQLKAMKPEEFKRAIGELDQVYRSLEDLKRANPRQYDMNLKVWKAKSHADLLSARYLSAPSDELEDEVESALRTLVKVEIEKQEQLETQLRNRLNQVEANLKRLKADSDRRVGSRLQDLKKKARRAKRQDDRKPASAPTGRAKKENET